jgi:hypothetical protein
MRGPREGECSWTDEERRERRRGAEEAEEDGGVNHGVFRGRELSSCSTQRELEGCRTSPPRIELEECRGFSVTYMGDIATVVTVVRFFCEEATIGGCLVVVFSCCVQSC